MRLWLTNYLDRRYPGWYMDTAVRYLPLVRELDGWSSLDILEVGSGPLGITPFLRRPVVGLDMSFHHASPCIVGGVLRVKGTVCALPFPDDSFACVLAVDMLEHLPREARPEAIAEIVRVARERVVVTVPCGAPARALDARMAQRYQKSHGHALASFEEHLRYGLPELGEVKQALRAAAICRGKGLEIKLRKNAQIWILRFLLAGWMSRNRFRSYIVNHLLLPTAPLMSHLNFGRCYRTILDARVDRARESA